MRVSSRGMLEFEGLKKHLNLQQAEMQILYMVESTCSFIVLFFLLLTGWWTVAWLLYLSVPICLPVHPTCGTFSIFQRTDIYVIEKLYLSTKADFSSVLADIRLQGELFSPGIYQIQVREMELSFNMNYSLARMWSSIMTSSMIKM